MATLAPRFSTKIEYPDMDGKPMAESDFQAEPLMYGKLALKRHFKADPNIYVSGNLLLYYEKGNPESVVAPDVFVAMGVPKHDRRSFKLWEEPKGPDFVIEITSLSTYTHDQGPKKGTYAFLGVSEYFQYDPTQDYLNPPLQGYRLVDNYYLPIPATTLPDGTFVLHSNVLQLDLYLQNGILHFFNPETEEYLLTYDEAEDARLTAEQARQGAERQAQIERAARLTAEARIAELEAQLKALQARPE
jgi:Uma2 family endonuclease